MLDSGLPFGVNLPIRFLKDEAMLRYVCESGIRFVTTSAGSPAKFMAPLKAAGARVSMFIGHDPRQIEASARIGAAVVELHTGHYCDLHAEGRFADRDAELVGLRAGAALAHSLGLEVHAGHGLTYDNVAPVAAMPQVMELNIGHFLIGEAIYLGLEDAILEMRRRMDDARA